MVQSFIKSEFSKRQGFVELAQNDPYMVFFIGIDYRAAHRDTPNEDASKMVSIYENMFFYTNLLYVYLVYI